MKISYEKPSHYVQGITSGQSAFEHQSDKKNTLKQQRHDLCSFQQLRALTMVLKGMFF